MGASNSKVAPSPFEQLLEDRRAQASCMPYKRGQASAFYFHCANGELEKVRAILINRSSPPIHELNKLQANGSTPLHAATFNGHVEVVRLLLEHDCPTATLNRFGNTAYDEAYTDELKALFHRDRATRRFCEENIHGAIAVYLPDSGEDNATNESDPRADYVHLFKSESEVFEYSLNQQTTAMWLKFYNWFTHTFRSLVEQDGYHIDAFDLHRHQDFQEFLLRHLPPENARKTRESIDRARQENSIDPLIILYTSEAVGFYQPFNRVLAQSSETANNDPHLCDRFLMEFYLHKTELKRRAFTGITFRGATITSEDFKVYNRALTSRPLGVLGLRAFTSTSRERSVALRFMAGVASDPDKKKVMFIFEIQEPTSTIFGIEDISQFSHEQEVLILPGNLFTVTKIEQNGDEEHFNIHLKHIKLSISFWRKLRQTIQAGMKPVS